MKNVIKMYAIEWHNDKNYSNKVFTTYEEALVVYENCSAEDSFYYVLMKEIIWDNGDKPLFNIEKVVRTMKSYDLPETHKITTNVLMQKDISNNGVKTKIDTGDLANYIQAVQSVNTPTVNKPTNNKRLFLCDLCGKEKSGKRYPVCDENWNKQTGIYMCERCFDGI